MFALFKAKNLYEQDARKVYGAILTHVRQAGFYTGYGVPDTLDGRFDLMVLHMFMVIERCLKQGAEGRKFNQALFDVAFADQDQGLRESGIGDMGIPKHMRRMMTGFNGRVTAYQQAIHDDGLEAALLRNLYGTVQAPMLADVRAMKSYVEVSRAMLDACAFDDILSGHPRFAELK